MANIKNIFIDHFRNNFLIYFIVTIILMVGISSGVISIKMMSEAQRNNLSNFLNSFFNTLETQRVNNVELLKYSLVNNLKTTLIIWGMGVIILGVPVTLLIVLLRGFSLGFSIGFIINELGMKGFLVSLFSLLPQNIFIIPGIIIVASLSISFSVNFIKNRFKNRSNNSLKQLVVYTVYMLFVSSIFLFGSIVEGYLTPYIMKVII